MYIILKYINGKNTSAANPTTGPKLSNTPIIRNNAAPTGGKINPIKARRVNRPKRIKRKTPIHSATKQKYFFMLIPISIIIIKEYK